MAILRVEPNIINSNGSYNMDSIAANTVTVSGAILPTVSNVINIGSPTQRFGTLYLAGNTIDIGGAQISSTEGNVSFATNSGNIELNALLIDFLSNVSTQGPAGVQGEKGFTGSQGSIGFVGSQGVPGNPGGYTGSSGFVGSKGDPGGYTGSAGFTGSTGSAGTAGTAGFTGSAGSPGGYTGSRGTTGFAGSVGATGPIGTTGFTGSRGAYDAVGFTGSQGSIGFTGSLGDTGGIGYTGSQGTTGFIGSQGIQGQLGFTGSTGVGFAGSAGFTGSAGTGFTGSAGAAGAQGVIGFTGSAGGGGGGAGYTGSAGTPGALASGQATNTFTGNGTTTAFTLSVAPVSKDAVTVNIDGVTQQRSGYAVSGFVLTLDEAPLSGEVIEVTIATYGTTNFVTRTYTGNGNTANYAVTLGTTVDSVIVTENGVVQTPTSDYTITGNVLSFVGGAPAAGTAIGIREIPAGAVGGNSVYSRTAITATAGQTTFAVAYTVGFLAVYFNGVLLNSVDYTATNGSTVVLTDAAAADDIVEFITYNVVPVTVVPVATFNSTNLTANLAITAGYSAVSVGPINIASGVSVSIADGQKWVIL